MTQGRLHVSLSIDVYCYRKGNTLNTIIVYNIYYKKIVFIIKN